MRTLPIQVPPHAYSVHLGAGLLAELPRHLEELNNGKRRRSFVLTSPEIWTLWSETFLRGFPTDAQPTLLLIPSGEAHKRLAVVERLAQQMARSGADRRSLLIAFGGGVVGDVAGFLAAIYMRGIDYVQVPTTLLAQVDSSVGGKTGVNLSVGKNLIGSFHHPRLVLADTAVLRTLPPAELRAGLYESLKAGLICDRALFDYIEQHSTDLLAQRADALDHVIAESIRIKARVVEEDERESGQRMLLNFGHTIGHAIESVTKYRTLLHGEAVGWGMRVAVEVSRKRGLPDAEADRCLRAIDALELPLLPKLSARRLQHASAGDKKHIAGVRRYVLLSAIGEAYIATDVTDQELLRAIGRGLRLDAR